MTNLSDLDVSRALVVGDMHGNLFAWQRTILPAFKKLGADLIIQVGDFGYGWNADYLTELDGILDDASDACGKRVHAYWLDGNHENFDQLEQVGAFPNQVTPQETSDHTTYLPRGYVWEWHGKRLMALGGAYSVDKFYRTPHRSWWPQEEITEEDVVRAQLAGHVDVFFAHDCFQGVRVPGVHADWKQDEFEEVCRPNRQRLLVAVASATPGLFVHGHFHKNYTQEHVLGVERIVGLNCEDAQGSAIVLDFPSLEWSWADGATPARYVHPDEERLQNLAEAFAWDEAEAARVAEAA
jgi:predicted phosphodiesterase